MVCMTMSKGIEPGRIKIVLDLVFKTPQLCGTKARHHHDYEENQCAMYTQPFVWPPRQPQIYLSISDAPWEYHGYHGSTLRHIDSSTRPS